jgi:beta-N-acetylhexosaminidase
MGLQVLISPTTIENSLEANIKAGIRTLFLNEQSTQGFNRPTGKLPVEIKSEDGLSVLYPFGHGLSY